MDSETRGILDLETWVQWIIVYCIPNSVSYIVDWTLHVKFRINELLFLVK